MKSLVSDLLDKLTNTGPFRFMKRLTVGEFKNRFSDVIARVRKGEKIAVEYGKKHEIIGIFGPPEKPKKIYRKLGLLKRRGKLELTHDFRLTTEEFLGLD